MTHTNLEFALVMSWAPILAVLGLVGYVRHTIWHHRRGIACGCYRGRIPSRYRRGGRRRVPTEYYDEGSSQDSTE